MRFIIIPLFLIFFSCNISDDINHSKTKLIKIQVNSDTLKLSKYFDDINYKILNIPDSMIIGEISYYFDLDNYQILIDGNYSKTIYLFDKEDRFIKRYINIGNGPSQYNKIVNCAVDDDNNSLIIFDRQKIIIYSIPDFKFIKNINLSGMGGFVGMDYFNNAVYLYSASKYSNRLGMLGKINIINEEKKILIKNVPDMLEKYPLIGIQHFTKYNNKLYFLPSFSTNIFEIDSFDNITIRYKFANDQIIPNYSDFINIENPKKLRQALKPYYNCIHTFHINEAVIYTFFPLGDSFYYGYALKNSGILNIFKKQINDVDSDVSAKYVTGSYVPNNLNLHIEQIHPENLLRIIATDNEKKAVATSISESPEKKSIPESLLVKLSNKNVPILVFFSTKKGTH